MRIAQLLIAVFIFCGLANKSFSQDISLSASFSNDSIIIGQPTELIIMAEFPDDIVVKPAFFEDTVTEKIEILKTFEIEKSSNSFLEKYLVTSFDTGYHHVPGIKLLTIAAEDTSHHFTNDFGFYVYPYVIIDTIPVDTIYAEHSGFAVFGKNGFIDEINQTIPDSVRRNISVDSLNLLRESIAQQYLNLFSSQLMQHTGITDNDAVIRIANAKQRDLFIIDKDGINNTHIVPGSFDTVFISDMQQVTRGVPLFTVYRIKDIEEHLFTTPLNLSELWFLFVRFIKKYWWVLLILLAAAIVTIYYFKYYIKGEVPSFIKIKPEAPPHIIALKKLEEIKKEKIWSKGYFKEYHVNLTNVVREYLDKRFGVNAMEMTSSEIIDALEKHVDEAELGKLKQIFLLADAVKFAKAVPVQNENDLSLSNAFSFVKETKEVEEPESNNAKIIEAEIEVPQKNRDEK